MAPTTAHESTDGLINRGKPISYPRFATYRSAFRSLASFRIHSTIGRTDVAWQDGFSLGVILVASILVLNAVTTLYATIRFSIDNGLGTLYRGPCWEVKRMGFDIHILINVVGTLLLGTSNYFMQRLTCPTREEIDARHRDKRWLEIGILSLRNLRAIDKSRVWLWFFLGLSSFPIHLMYISCFLLLALGLRV